MTQSAEKDAPGAGTFESRILDALRQEDEAVRQPGYTCETECMETNHPGREHLAWWDSHKARVIPPEKGDDA